MEWCIEDRDPDQTLLIFILFKVSICLPGPGCSKLTTSLVNETLKFQMLISHICQYVLVKKCEKLTAKAFFIFSTKISMYLVIKS